MNKLLNILFIAMMTITRPAIAGSAQDTEIQFTVAAVEKFAKEVEKFAAKEGARAFIIGRVGRPEKELPKGIKFTHTAVAIYSSIKLDSGETVKGYAIHNLYQKKGQLDKSELIIDYPVDFFWGVNSLKAGVIIPTPDLQKRILDVIASGKDKLIHNKNYSVIANPFNNIFQNCTEHTLNIVNSGIYQTTDIQQLKSNTKQHFKPQKVKASPFKLLLGNWFVDDVSTKDHSGSVYTTTFTAIGKYLKNNNLLSKAVVLKTDGSTEQLL
ncbi:hypothetical protein NBRC116592_10830 [Colwellia sp. KU-HH00111]|uniref:DUF2145 domain-containing protein n=1 Tax=Colwellia sp. KU-HH00111 TaxID=3127652 RepID=UPI00310A156C